MNRRPLDVVLDHLPHGFKETGKVDQFYARCPGPLHRRGDQWRSLSIRAETSIDGELVLMHCFTGCDNADVLDAMGLRFGDLFATDNELSVRPRYQRNVIPMHLRRAMQQLLEIDEAKAA